MQSAEFNFCLHDCFSMDIFPSRRFLFVDWPFTVITPPEHLIVTRTELKRKRSVGNGRLEPAISDPYRHYTLPTTYIHSLLAIRAVVSRGVFTEELYCVEFSATRVVSFLDLFTVTIK